ncbi:hypothetical protein FQR65_LT14732 [Abscondita terminalis]|nr:hypothetical protein FQR65_LT14732 [Abscondita terminalis]
MRVIVPPIKSQGIKTKLVPWIMELAPKVQGKWIEPFLGTGVVAFNSGYKKAILNDTNPHIINFYKGIQDKEITAPLMKHYLENEGAILSKAENNGYEHYLEVRSRFNSGEFSPYDFIFLSRAGFNGMMRFNNKGHWNIPFCKKPDRFAQAYITKITNQTMARQKGLMKYVGTIGDVRHFKIKGQQGFFAGMVGGPTAEQVKTAPEFERTRENMNEFGGCARAGNPFVRALSALMSKMADASYRTFNVRNEKNQSSKTERKTRGYRKVEISTPKKYLF